MHSYIQMLDKKLSRNKSISNLSIRQGNASSLGLNLSKKLVPFFQTRAYITCAQSAQQASNSKCRLWLTKALLCVQCRRMLWQVHSRYFLWRRKIRVRRAERRSDRCIGFDYDANMNLYSLFQNKIIEWVIICLPTNSNSTVLCKETTPSTLTLSSDIAIPNSTALSAKSSRTPNLKPPKCSKSSNNTPSRSANQSPDSDRTTAWTCEGIVQMNRTITWYSMVKIITP